MKQMKILLFLILFMFLVFIVQNGYARIGVGISPASGTFNFTLDGGTVDFTVYNSGDTDMNYTIVLSGTAANFTTIEPAKAEVTSGSYAIFKATINPTSNVKEGETYILIADAKAADTGAIAVGAESRISIYLAGERTKPYGFSLLDILASNISYILIGIFLALVIIVVYFVVKKSRESDFIPWK